MYNVQPNLTLYGNKTQLLIIHVLICTF